MADRPAAEVVIDEVLVRSLLEAQAPEYADRPLRRVAEGWDNEMWLVGTEHAVRLPRRASAAPLIEHEQRWLAQLAPSLPIPVPHPRVVGTPSAEYPWSWSIVDWHRGEPLDDRPGTASMAASMGGFLRALQVAAPSDAPPNEFRGVALADRASTTDRWFAATRTKLDSHSHVRLRTVWDEALAAPRWTSEPVWLHGDLHPRNLVVDGDDLAAVVDFGDLASGDPACDLAVAWMAFEPPERLLLQAALPATDDATWTRARGWAVAFGVAILSHSDDVPVMEAIARTIVARVLDERPG